MTSNENGDKGNHEQNEKMNGTRLPSSTIGDADFATYLKATPPMDLYVFDHKDIEVPDVKNISCSELTEVLSRMPVWCTLCYRAFVSGVGWVKTLLGWIMVSNRSKGGARVE